MSDRPIFLVDIFKVVGRLAERPLSFKRLGPCIQEAAIIPLEFSRRVSEYTGIRPGALVEAMYRLGEGRCLAGDWHLSLEDEHSDEYGWRHVDLTRVAEKGYELDRNGNTARLWRELCERWPIVRACHHELFPGEVEATVESAIGVQRPASGEVADDGSATATVEWSPADTIGRWARVFGVGRKKMAELLQTQKIRNKPLGTKIYMIAIADMPAKHRPNFLPPASEKTKQ
jgi:hypothetical protein